MNRLRILSLIASASAAATACQKKDVVPQGTAQDSSAASQRMPDELMEDHSVEVPHCTKPGEKVKVDYKRVKSGSLGEFGFPMSLCLNGMEAATKNQIASLQLFVDMRFTSDFTMVAERLAKQSALLFRRQTVKTTVVNPRGEMGTLEYALNPMVTFNFEKDLCKMRVAQVALNMTDVRVTDFPVGPKWLPRGVADALGSFGLNFVKFIDEAGITSNKIVPLLNGWLADNLTLMGCDRSKRSSFVWVQDFSPAGTDPKPEVVKRGWYPPRETPTPTPTPDRR